MLVDGPAQFAGSAGFRRKQLGGEYLKVPMTSLKLLRDLSRQLPPLGEFAHQMLAM